MPLSTKGQKVAIKKSKATAVAATGAAAQPALDNKSHHPSELPSKAVGKTLEVPQVQQLALNWCWAGCCAMLVNFFHEQEAQQCRMANQLFGQQACCSLSNNFECDRACQLDDVSKIFSKFGIRAKFQKGPVAFEKIQAEIEAGRPVAVGIAWDEGGGHIVLIRGCFEVGREKFLKINDPQDASVSFRSLTDVRNACKRGEWKWSWTGIRKIKLNNNGGGK